MPKPPKASARVAYIELPAPDLPLAAAFYREVFGWAIEASDLSETPYAMFETHGLQGGLRSNLAPASTGGAILYLEVDSIPAALERIRSAGGESVAEETPVGGDYGFSAEFRDPNGNLLGLWCPRSEQGAGPQ